MEITKEKLFEVEIPNETKTYTPISHKDIYQQTMEELDKNNLQVVNEKFIASRHGEQMIARLMIESSNSNFGHEIAFRNSYDKSLSVGYVAGNTIWVCKNGQMSGDINFMRKHTGSVVEDLRTAINNTIIELSDKLYALEKQSENMKKIQVEQRLSAQLAGMLFVEKNLITSEQLNIIKKEVFEPTYVEFADPTLWSFYNHVTHSLKKSHPSNYIKNHLNFHKFIEKEFVI